MSPIVGIGEVLWDIYADGRKVAGGAGLVTGCDLAVAVPGAKFGYPEVRRGLVAAMGDAASPAARRRARPGGSSSLAN